MRGVLDTTLCDKVCQWLATGRWFSPGTPVTPTNKTDLHDIAEILLKVPLNTINKPTKKPKFKLIILMTQISIGIRRPDVTPRKENTPCVTTIKGNSPVTYNYRLCRGLLGRKENPSPTFWVEMYWWHRPTQIKQSYNRAHDSPWKCNELISKM